MNRKSKKKTKTDVDLAATAGIQERTKLARKNANLERADVAAVFGVGKDAVRKWETRGGSIIPGFYVERFCIITHIDAGWLFTGTQPTRQVTVAASLQDHVAATAHVVADA